MLYRQRGDDVYAMAHEVKGQWDSTHELLAQLVEAVSILRIEAFLIAGVPRRKLPDPHHVRRPWEKQEVVVLRPSEFARLSVAG